MLSTPTARTPLHTREITFSGYARDDGLWDIEAHLIDIKSHPFTTGSKTWAPGEAIHDMWLRLTLNAELEIKAIEVSMDSHPHPECPEVIPPMDALIGARLGKGWRKVIDAHLGGIKGPLEVNLNDIVPITFFKPQEQIITRNTSVVD